MVVQNADYAIELSQLTKMYGDFAAVNHIDLRVKKGEIFAFLGPNGAGKSTTIKMLTTLLRPTSGSLKLMGREVTDDPTAARKSFGVVFQDPSLDDGLTAYENMEFHATLYGLPRKGLRERIMELLKLVELDDREKALIKTFSGGMRRRLEIARGLLHKPHVLFLDEPTLGLDTQTRNLLWNYVRQLRDENGMTIFFTTHYIEEAEAVADRIAMIDHGEIIALGTADELKKQTKTDKLEKAYLALTGTTIREEKVSNADRMRMRGRMGR